MNAAGAAFPLGALLSMNPTFQLKRRNSVCATCRPPKLNLGISSLAEGEKKVEASVVVSSDYMWGKVVEARCGIDVALASTASPVPHAVKCAVICVTWCIQLQCVGYLFPALLIYCSFWSSSSIILVPIIGVFTFTKILILRILKCLTTWCFQKKKQGCDLGIVVSKPTIPVNPRSMQKLDGPFFDSKISARAAKAP